MSTCPKKKCTTPLYKYPNLPLYGNKPPYCGVNVSPYSETRVTPDAQWRASIPICSCGKIIKQHFNYSSENPSPQWSPNIIIRSSNPNCKYNCPFLISCCKDNIPMYVMGKNPLTNTVNSGGSHFN